MEIQHTHIYIYIYIHSQHTYNMNSFIQRSQYNTSYNTHTTRKYITRRKKYSTKQFFSFVLSLAMTSVSFPSDQRISILCSQFCLSLVNSGSKPLCFSSVVFYDFFSSSFLCALNCALITCVTSIFCIVNVESFLRLPLVNSSASYK